MVAAGRSVYRDSASPIGILLPSNKYKGGRTIYAQPTADTSFFFFFCEEPTVDTSTADIQQSFCQEQIKGSTARHHNRDVDIQGNIGHPLGSWLPRTSNGLQYNLWRLTSPRISYNFFCTLTLNLGTLIFIIILSVFIFIT